MPERILLIILCCTPLSLAAQNLDDFAYQAEISKAPTELQHVLIPMSVLLNITRPDLADVAVFDRKGNLLPHAVMKTLPTVSNERIDLKIHEFDVFYNDHSKLVTTRRQKRAADQLSELETTETIETKLRRTDYLIELPDDKQVREIEIEWSQQPQNQLLKLRLEAGTDLDNLRVIDAGKALSNLNPDDPDWRKIDNIPGGQKYLRITPAESLDRFELLRAVGHYQTRHPPARLKHKVEFFEIAIKDRSYYYFETPTSLTPEALSIVPGQPHSTITATIFAGSGEFEKSRLIHSGLRQHNISSDKVDANRPLILPRRHYRHWWVRIEEPTPIPPEIYLHYPQYEILFLGDENPPYSLAWGNYRQQKNNATLSGLLKIDLNSQENRGARVSLLPARTAGGEARLSPDATLPWKKWLLWLLLAVAAMVTGRMALTLYREMNQTK